MTKRPLYHKTAINFWGFSKILISNLTTIFLCSGIKNIHLFSITSWNLLSGWECLMVENLNERLVRELPPHDLGLHKAEQSNPRAYKVNLLPFWTVNFLNSDQPYITTIVSINSIFWWSCSVECCYLGLFWSIIGMTMIATQGYFGHFSGWLWSDF